MRWPTSPKCWHSPWNRWRSPNQRYEDVEAPGTFVEHFVVATWAEHERQHERPTAADEFINEAARQFLLAGHPLRVEHRIAATVRRQREVQVPSFVEMFHHALHRR
jgi:hypothetical protein